MNTSKKPAKQKAPVKELLLRYSLIEELFIVGLFYITFEITGVERYARERVEVGATRKIRYNAQKWAVL